MTAHELGHHLIGRPGEDECLPEDPAHHGRRNNLLSPGDRTLVGEDVILGSRRLNPTQEAQIFGRQPVSENLNQD